MIDKSASTIIRLPPDFMVCHKVIPSEALAESGIYFAILSAEKHTAEKIKVNADARHVTLKILFFMDISFSLPYLGPGPI